MPAAPWQFVQAEVLLFSRGRSVLFPMRLPPVESVPGWRKSPQPAVPCSLPPGQSHLDVALAPQPRSLFLLWRFLTLQFLLSAALSCNPIQTGAFRVCLSSPIQFRDAASQAKVDLFLSVPIDSTLYRLDFRLEIPVQPTPVWEIPAFPSRACCRL